jgi:hypothetical protein
MKKGQMNQESRSAGTNLKLQKIGIAVWSCAVFDFVTYKSLPAFLFS